MKLHALFQQVIVAILFSSLFVGCNAFLQRDLSTLTPVDSTETLIPTFTPTVSSTPTVSVTPSPRLTSTVTPMPEWVVTFANPILVAIKDREPDFQDDFSTDTKRWYSVTLYGFDFNKTLVIKDGVMRLDKAEGISNYHFLHKPNIVLQVDVLHPIIGRVSICPSFYFRIHNKMEDALTLSSNIDWDVRIATYSTSGIHTYNEQRTQVIMIVDGSQIAYYINGVPVAYHDDPSLLLDKDNKRYFTCSMCVLDNVKVWNLGKTSDSP